MSPVAPDADAAPHGGRAGRGRAAASAGPPPAAEEGGPGGGTLAALLDSLPGPPFRLDVEADGGEADVLHDTLSAGAPTRTVRLRTPGGREARLTVPDDARAGELEALTGAVRAALTLEEERKGAARQLSERNEEISLLTSIGETLGSVIQLDRAARQILQRLVEVTGAARATLWLHEPHDEELALLASRGRTVPVTRRVAVDDGGSLVARVFRTQEPLLAEPGGEGVPPELKEAWAGFGDAAVLAVPVTYTPPEGQRRRVGVLALVGRREGGRFGFGDRMLMSAIASQVGVVVENGRLVRESLRRERLAAELRMAHDLQAKLLPDPASVADLAEAAARCEPAASVGGDFYHLLRLSGGRLGVMVGDVASHGVSAALVMAQAMSAAGIVAREEEGPAAVVRRIGRELRRELASTEMFLSLFYAVVTPGGRTLRYASAGHPHAFLLSTGDPRRLDASSPPLGVDDLGSLEERSVGPVGEGDVLFVFTDGLFEPARRRREDEAELVGSAAAGVQRGPARVVQEAFDASDVLRREGEGGDDRTALAVRL